MKNLTKEQLEKLNKAIDLAELPGSCQYVVDGKPCCIIAQLAVLEGVPLNRLNKQIHVGAFIKLGELSELESYPKELLYDIQQQWDISGSLSLEEARAELRNYLD